MLRAERPAGGACVLVRRERPYPRAAATGYALSITSGSRRVHNRILLIAPVAVLLALAITFVLGGWAAAIVLLVVTVVVFGCVYDGGGLS